MTSRIRPQKARPRARLRAMAKRGRKNLRGRAAMPMPMAERKALDIKIRTRRHRPGGSLGAGLIGRQGEEEEEEADSEGAAAMPQEAADVTLRICPLCDINPSFAKCQRCRGKGTQRCRACFGRGCIVPGRCSTCRGYGRVHGGARGSCRDCGGEGLLPPAACEGCAGSARVECGSCCGRRVSPCQDCLELEEMTKPAAAVVYVPPHRRGSAIAAS
mmetsp:Transcript_11577/g.17223  ORF Transcript_11577/g.17223 Transcript_11577/m.17223 type:complete len:216 (+) Transcript_11577:269-916(+)